MLITVCVLAQIYPERSEGGLRAYENFHFVS